MALFRINAAADIVNGATVINTGAKFTTYDNTARTQHIPSGTTPTVLSNINSRYLRHGGVSGSGQWEH